MNWRKYFYSLQGELPAGTLLLLKSGEILIIGDINRNLGYCDCCGERDAEYYCTDFVDQFARMKEQAYNIPRRFSTDFEKE